MRREGRLQGLKGLALAAALALPSVAAAGAVLEPKVSPSDTYGENFSFIGDLDDGTFIFAQLTVTNIGPGSRIGLCRTTVLTPGQKAWSAQTKVKSRDWGYDAKTATLKMGPCSARSAQGATRVEVPLDGGRVLLEYAAPMMPQAREGSEVEVGKDRYHHEVTLAFSPLKATVQRPRGEDVVYTGGGYADHTRTTIAPAKLAKRWVRFRALRGDEKLVLLAREGQDGEYGPVYAWEEGAKARPLEHFTLAREGVKEKSAWKVELFAGGASAMVLRSTSLLQRSAPVEDLGAVLGSLVRSVVGSPVTYLHRAVLEREGKAPVTGLMEVTLEGDL
ncbi:hypothetical protein [Corallococcus macrosporus]|uniref:Uncharacterized protein n=1 Tax=Corallococcus macrosporus DSM 14697 TaxID=1189310 RepID=A0A250JN34_9BACT|nr:hypothetical protein [Corallococcus macrosporus]ATB44907.1 hypothetical protein MYMAC_000490 [Corallococcus macrosporus DSM 14697]